MEETREEILDTFIKQIMKNNHYCNHCVYCHNPNSDETFCFFAYACLTEDFSYFNGEDD